MKTARQPAIFLLFKSNVFDIECSVLTDKNIVYLKRTIGLGKQLLAFNNKKVSNYS